MRFPPTSIVLADPDILAAVPIEKDILMTVPTLRCMVLLGLPLLLTSPAMGQASAGAPPAVGVITAQKRPMAESTEINGRIQAPVCTENLIRVDDVMESLKLAK
jgi:hypothetical protein